MISDDAARALGLISAIDLCKQADAAFWQGMVARIVVDLDEIAAEREMIRVLALLEQMWGELPDRPGGPGFRREGGEDGAEHA